MNVAETKYQGVIAALADNGDSHIYQLNLVSDTLTQNIFVNGLDDLAPASGLGSVPEPSSFMLAEFALAGLAAWSWRRRNRLA